MVHVPSFRRLTGRLVIMARLAVLLILVSTMLVPGTQAAAATPVTLGAAGSYSVLAGTTVTNTGSTTMPGNLGVSPGSACTGFTVICTPGPGIVGPPGTIHLADPNAAAAQADATAVFNNAITGINQPCVTTYAGVQDLTLVSPLGPGVYCATGAFILTGNLVLAGSGVWIFKSASTLTTAANSSVTGGDPCNVWWRLASSTGNLGAGSHMIGNILALTSITLQTGATLNGRLLAQTGQVTLQNNRITGPQCAASSGSGGGSGGGGSPAPTITPGGPTPGQGAALPVRRLPATGYTSADPLPVLALTKSIPIGQIIFPAAQVSAPIVEAERSGGSWEVSYLGAAAGHLAGTSWNDTSGNIVVAGHVNSRLDGPGAFTYLFQAKVGDALLLRAGQREVSYHVVTVTQVAADDTQVVAQTGPARLTLITCFWDQKTQSFTGRLVVVAVPSR